MSGGVTVGWRRRVALVGLTLAIQASPRRAPAQEPEPPPWRVLILYGSDVHVPATAAVDAALRSTLREGAAPRLVTFHSEVLDLLSFAAADHEPELLALFRKKHYPGRLDLVVPIAGEALQFAERHYAVLWPGVPIVCVGASPEALRADRIGANTTGVAIGFDEAGTLRLARRLQPDAERLVLVAGDSEYDRGWWPRLEAAAAREAGGLEVERLFGRPLPALLDRASRLPARSIVLYTTVTRDARGHPVTPAIVAEQLSRASGAPVYTVLESQLGSGVVGGSMESFADHGRRGAGVALRVLRGTPASAIPIPAPENPVPVVDWRQLQRFGLSERALPPGSQVRYRPPSLFVEYRGYVVTAALVLLVQTGLIVALLAQARRRRRAVAEAAQRRAELAHAARLSAVGQLTAAVAHEINQPLGAILSNAEAAELFLASDPPQLERVRRILRDIQQEDQRASAVIREVRALARKQSPEPKPLDLNDVVRAVVPLVGADARRRFAELELDLDSRPPLTSGDATQLQQVVLNLALNGLDALGRPAPGARRIRIVTRSGDGHVELTVADTGPGIAEEALPRLFESFFTTKADGLGLGLSVVRSIVDAHGGQVTAENGSAGGATFRVRLPARGAAPPPRPAA